MRRAFANIVQVAEVKECVLESVGNLKERPKKKWVAVCCGVEERDALTTRLGTFSIRINSHDYQHFGAWSMEYGDISLYLGPGLAYHKDHLKNARETSVGDL